MPALRSETLWFYVFSLLFAGLNAFFFYFDFPFFSFLPVALIIIYIALFHLDQIFWIVVLATPLSLNISEFTEIDFGLFLPTEPLLFGILFLFSLHLIMHGKYDKKVLNHPLTFIILLHLVWMMITAITSEEPGVSLKFFAARLWFVIPIYFFGILLFRNSENIKKFFWFFIIPLSIVIVYTVIHHASLGFEEKPAHWVMSPFFKDHTVYGAVLAMFYPIVIGLYLNKKFPPLVRSVLFFLIVIFTAGIVFSYTRAAWVSILAAFGLFGLLWFRIKMSTIIVGIAAAGFLVFSFYDQIIMNLEKNKTDSSDDLAEHVQSISNISSDASNLERINRWNCALRMWQEKPVFGWGPGTYQFHYAPFQHSSELTIISTNFGNLGNAHSEYLGPLSEQGVLGMLFMVVLVGTVMYYGISLYLKMEPGEIRLFLVMALLGLTTYFIHGILNNYLDTDKASVPFWGLIAVIVAIDVYHKNGAIERGKLAS
jgi:putative inorganic carbon (hco3(-)) transporter